MRAEEWDRRYEEKPWLWRVEPNVFLVSEVGEMTPGRALDVACGEGRNAVWLAERGWQVDAVDFSQVAIERARELARQRGVEVNFTVADVTRYRPEPDAYDLVVILYLHLPPEQRRDVIARAREAVASGGTMLVIGHDLENLERGWGGPPDPEVHYTPDEIAFELEPLTIVKAERVVRAVETDEGVREAIDTLVRARRP